MFAYHLILYSHSEASCQLTETAISRNSWRSFRIGANALIHGSAHVFPSFVVSISGGKAALEAQADKMKAAVAEGCMAENDFRGVKPGEVRKGVVSDIRWSVK